MSELSEIESVINNFSKIMLNKMSMNLNKKDGWDDIDIVYAMAKIRSETSELYYALIDQNKSGAQKECADIANYCMMIYLKCKNLEESK